MSYELLRIEISEDMPDDLTETQLIVWVLNNTTTTLLGTTTIDVVSKDVVWHVARWNLVGELNITSLSLMWTDTTISIQWDNNPPINSYNEWLHFLSVVKVA